MDSDPETAKPETLFDKLERLEGRATCDFLSGDYGPPATGGLPEPACRAGGTIPSSAKLTVFDLLNAESTLAERKLLPLSIACPVSSPTAAGTAARKLPGSDWRASSARPSPWLPCASSPRAGTAGHRTGAGAGPMEQVEALGENEDEPSQEG
jgi:hypothetical protein